MNALSCFGCFCDPCVAVSTTPFTSLTGCTSVSGSWSISSGAATTSSTNALLTYDTPHPDVTIMRVEASVTLNNDAEARLLFNYVDSSNYYYLEWKHGSAGHLKLFVVSGGTPTEIGKTYLDVFLTGPQTRTMEVCISNVGTIVGRLRTVTQQIIFSAIQFDRELIEVSGYPVTIGTVGVGTGSTAPSSVLFNDLSLYNRNSLCVNCASYCSGLNRTQYEVIISGCSAPYTGLNGTWYLDTTFQTYSFYVLPVNIAFPGGNITHLILTFYFDTGSCGAPSGRMVSLAIYRASANAFNFKFQKNICNLLNCDYSAQEIATSPESCIITGSGG